MAEIKIEKKKPIWPWVLIVLIILAAIYFFWYYNDRNYNSDENLIDNDSITQLDKSNIYDNEVFDTSTVYNGKYGTVRDEQALTDYLKFVDIDKNIDKETGNEYYRSAFFKLITATKRESEIKNIDINDDIAAAMKNAELLTNDPAISQNSDKIKATAENVSKALRKIQQKSFSGLLAETNDVDSAAKNINSSGKIEENRNDINSFFDKAAILLHKMYQSEEQNR